MASSLEHNVVLGLGVSGEAAAQLLLGQGAAVTVLDAANTLEKRQRAEALKRRGARVVLGELPLPAETYSRCIVSPGVPLSSPWIREARAREVPLLSELELGWQHRRSARVLAITGSNGKSSVASFCRDALARSGYAAALGGNFGTPACALVAREAPWDWLVLEVSSFQLETVCGFRAEVGVMLNVYPNHLDRHKSIERYGALKARLFAHTKIGDTCVVPGEWMDRMRAESGGGAGQWVLAEPDELGPRLAKTPAGEALGQAGMAAASCALRAVGIGESPIEEAARAFKPLPHRRELVGCAGGVTYINDSKATNLAALTRAVDAISGPILLIAGGVCKEETADSVKEVLAQRVKKVYLVGQAAGKFERAWSGGVVCETCGTLTVALKRAREEALVGDTVLFSPGCASFDQFPNFVVRGEAFCTIVKEFINHSEEVHVTRS